MTNSLVLSNRSIIRVGVRPVVNRDGAAGDTLADEAPPRDAALDDEVLRLREWGTSRALPLRVPVEPARATHAEGTGLQHVSRSLARAPTDIELVYEGAWRVKDLAGLGGLKQDGIAAREVTLLAGAEITVAGRTLIAESARSIALRNFCCRLLGWGDAHAGVVDQALRSIRLAAAGRAVLVLQGTGDVVPIAYAIHQHALGQDRPFIVSDRRRGDLPATVRSPENVADALAAFRKASGGTLCLRANRRPAEFSRLLEAFRDAGNTVQLVMCAGKTRDAFALGATPIEIPTLETRRAELRRIVDEYVEEAAEWLRMPSARLSAADVEWLLGERGLTIPKIEKAVFRLLAFKISRNLSAAAERLGMAPVSLSRWFVRRGRG